MKYVTNWWQDRTIDCHAMKRTVLRYKIGCYFLSLGKKLNRRKKGPIYYINHIYSFTILHLECDSLKQQNLYLCVIIVCGYFSFIRSFTWINLPSESNSYHKTSLSMSFGCWHLFGKPPFPLHFTVNTIVWQRKFEPKWVLHTNLCILSG